MDFVAGPFPTESLFMQARAGLIRRGGNHCRHVRRNVGFPPIVQRVEFHLLNVDQLGFVFIREFLSLDLSSALENEAIAATVNGPE